MQSIQQLPESFTASLDIIQPHSSFPLEGFEDITLDNLYDSNSKTASDDLLDLSTQRIASNDSSKKSSKQALSSSKGKKAHVCLECGQEFSQVSNLKRHEKLHTGEKPYACDQCDKAFSTTSNLKQHKQIHANTEQRTRYECQKCHKVYFYQSSLNKHLRSHAKKEAKKDSKKSTENAHQTPTPLESNIKLPKVESKSWEDSSLSDEQEFGISPTIKKVKKEVSPLYELTPKTAAETPNIKGVSSPDPNKVEEEFIYHYNRNLSKVLTQMSYNTFSNPLTGSMTGYSNFSEIQPLLPMQFSNQNMLKQERVPSYNDLCHLDSQYQPQSYYNAGPMPNPIYNYLTENFLSNNKPGLMNEGAAHEEPDFIGEIKDNGLNEANHMDKGRLPENSWNNFSSEFKEEGPGPLIDQWFSFDLQKEVSNSGFLGFPAFSN